MGGCGGGEDDPNGCWPEEEFEGGGVIGGDVEELNWGECLSDFTAIAFDFLFDFGGVGDSLLLFMFTPDPVMELSSDWDSAAAKKIFSIDQL